MADEVMTVKEVAEYLKVHYTTIYRLLKRHQIPAFQIGGRLALKRARADGLR
ncbi:MAG: helix-turn-helix domain-containing protein [Candidatus Binataceae bacterium]